MYFSTKLGQICLNKKTCVITYINQYSFQSMSLIHDI